MDRKYKDTLILDLRDWLRPKSARWGSMSSVHSNLTRADHWDEEGAKSSSIEGSFTIRDCSDSITLDFDVSGNHKHAISQIGVMYKLRKNIDRFIQAYEKLACDIRDNGSY